MDPYWSFFSFFDHGEDVIHQWMDCIDMKKKAIVKFETRLRYLSNTKVWSPDWVKKLKVYDGLYEIRIRYEQVQYRPLGCFGPNDREFTLLIGALEKNSKFVPKNAPNIALQRKELILKNRSLIHEYEAFIRQD